MPLWHMSAGVAWQLNPYCMTHSDVDLHHPILLKNTASHALYLTLRRESRDAGTHAERVHAVAIEGNAQ